MVIEVSTDVYRIHFRRLKIAVTKDRDGYPPMYVLQVRKPLGAPAFIHIWSRV